MELRQLKYFVQVAEDLNFTEASKKLFITQSTISQQIRQLEDELNISLFDRSAKKISLTEAGNEFLPHAIRVLRDADYGKQRLLDLQNIRTGELTVGVNYSFSNLLTDTVIEFLNRYPGIKLNILYKTVGELLEMIKKKEADIVLSYKPLEAEKNIESRTLFSTPLSVIARKDHPLASSGSVSQDKINEYQLALPAKGMHARTILDSSLFANHVILHPQIELNDVSMLLRLVDTGKWITILSASTIVGHDTLKAVPLYNINYEMQAALLWMKDSYQKFSAREFIKIFSEEKERILKYYDRIK
ncbi:MAG: LysR family transcriptional regulator [Bacteroidales bacterium]|jgi:LysR family cyn operon transcriptional activator|nr:LysR family transcriptional regulator [Bacteroidales bacterium]